jgi:hypothetical protein
MECSTLAESMQRHLPFMMGSIALADAEVAVVRHIHMMKVCFVYFLAGVAEWDVQGGGPCMSLREKAAAAVQVRSTFHHHLRVLTQHSQCLCRPNNMAAVALGVCHNCMSWHLSYCGATVCTGGPVSHICCMPSSG